MDTCSFNAKRDAPAKHLQFGQARALYPADGLFNRCEKKKTSGTIANALAFTGSQIAASALGGAGGSIEEVKRHNAALEQLQNAQAEYNQK